MAFSAEDDSCLYHSSKEAINDDNIFVHDTLCQKTETQDMKGYSTKVSLKPWLWYEKRKQIQ